MLRVGLVISERPSSTSFSPPDAGERDWQAGLPRLSSPRVWLRELQAGDAVSLLQAMTRSDVTRFISPPPATLEGFDQFIAWTRSERCAGNSICYGVVDASSEVVVGIFQVRALEPSFRVAEWGFALARECWGTGLFMESALLLLDFVFGPLGVHRLEARAVLRNARGNGALRKLGAAQEGVLRQSFFRNGEHQDQVLWTLLASDWGRSPEASDRRILN